MSHSQTGSLTILAFGLLMMVASGLMMSSPVLRLASRETAAELLHQENRLVLGMGFVLGFLITILGVVTYSQS